MFFIVAHRAYQLAMIMVVVVASSTMISTMSVISSIVALLIVSIIFMLFVIILFSSLRLVKCIVVSLGLHIFYTVGDVMLSIANIPHHFSLTASMLYGNSSIICNSNIFQISQKYDV